MTDGRVAIVTGAGRGLGRAMALGLARAGVRVIATAARERAEIEAVAAEAGEGMVVPVLADVARQPGGATLTGMVPDSVPRERRAAMLDPAIMVPPLLWLVSEAAGTITGCRVTANQWDAANPLTATETAGCGSR